MTLTIITPPADNPITLADAKAHLRVDADDEDDLIENLIRTATAHLDGRDGVLGRALMRQTWSLALDAFPPEIAVPLPPLTAVDSITYLDPDGAGQTLPEHQYQVIGLGGAAPARIRPAWGQSWPATRAQAEAVTVMFTAGYMDTAVSPAEGSVPEPIRQAILLHIGHLYAHREAVGEFMGEMPIGYHALIEAYRVHTF